MATEVKREIVPGRAQVTMTWEVPCDFENTESPGIRCEGWIADAEGLLASCRSDNVKKVEILRIQDDDG